MTIKKILENMISENYHTEEGRQLAVRVAIANIKRELEIRKENILRKREEGGILAETNYMLSGAIQEIDDIVSLIDNL